MISVFSPRISFKDKLAVFNAINKKNISGTSLIVNEFESKVSKRFDRNYGVAVANGSLALDCALQLIDLKEGDEVIIPSFTIVSGLSAILRTKATPVFCDVDESTWNMRLDHVEEKYTTKTKAVILVHTYGLPAEGKKIEDFCNKNDLFLIEDAAEAHGQNDEEKKCGSFGEISTLSFYANKHITTGEGGMVLVNSEELDKKARQIRNLDFTKENRFNSDNMYWNYRLGGLQSALGISQLNSLEKVISDKIIQGSYYLEILNEYKDLFSLPLKNIRSSKNHFWVFGVTINRENIRNKVINRLEEKGIETRPFFWPLHKQNFYSGNNSNLSLNVSENLGKNGLYIPLGSHINRKIQEEVVGKLVETTREFL